MPWTTADVDQFKKGLSPSEKQKWVKIANAYLKQCTSDGSPEAQCAALAVRIANSRTTSSE